MRTIPVILVALTLAAAILVAATLLIAGTRKSIGSSTLYIPSPRILMSA